MKTSGIVRNIDRLGRVVIPIELRRAYDIGENTPMEILTTSEGILIRPYTETCICCGRKKGLKKLRGICMCKACLREFNDPVV